MRALVGVLALGLLVAGCGREEPQAPPTRIPAGLQTRFYPPPGWTWSLIGVDGAPPLRYGVGTPPRAARGSVLILPGFAEPAETWFETAGQLIDDGFTVWILDLAGQGGSGRWLKPADKAHLPAMDPNLDAVRRMAAEAARPGGPPLFVLGSGLGGQLAIRAAADGVPGVDAWVVSAPALGDWPLATPRPLQSAALAQGAHLAGLGGRFAPGQGEWRADSSRRGAEPGTRAAVPQAWMRANPDLRTGGVTWSWLRTYSDSVGIARSPQTLGQVRAPVLMLDDSPQGRLACEGMPECRFASTPTGTPPHLAADAAREPWRRAVSAFLEDQASGYSVAAAPISTATTP